MSQNIVELVKSQLPAAEADLAEPLAEQLLLTAARANVSPEMLSLMLSERADMRELYHFLHTITSPRAQCAAA